MTVTRISAREAHSLMAQGYVYLDVRAVAEFDTGHPPGAYNVPLLEPQAGGGTRENPEFLRVLRASFDKDARIIVGCASGVRSLRAAELMLADGFSELVEQRAGMEGVRDAFGRLKESGHRAEQLPISLEAEPGRSYAALSRRATAR